ncbi:MAG: sigma-70 family RNA polymerase sigma factor [Ruminococcus sp.]|nr:sigma-70 family RNA polymerase sigma factor [Ruminococcus sp.]
MFELILSLLTKRFLFFALHFDNKSIFPKPLSSKEELACFERLAQGDKAAKDKLIEHNLRLVAHITKKYYAVSHDQDDLISIGTVGLIKAVNTFDYLKGSRFATYASRCIENATVSQRPLKCRSAACCAVMHQSASLTSSALMQQLPGA